MVEDDTEEKVELPTYGEETDKTRVEVGEPAACRGTRGEANKVDGTDGVGNMNKWVGDTISGYSMAVGSSVKGKTSSKKATHQLV